MGIVGDLRSSTSSFVAGLNRGSKVVMADKASRIQMFFAIAFFALSLLSFTISAYSNSLVVSLNGFVLLYRVMLCGGEAAAKAMTSTVVTAGGEKAFSYGLSRFEVLAQFSALSMLCFACLTAIIEGLQHMFQEHDVNPVSVELLCLLHIGTIVASNVKTNREGYLRAKRRGQKELAIFFVIECLGPLTCFVTVNLIGLTGMSRLDILAAMCLTVGTVLSAWEQIGKVSGILLLQAPLHLKPLLDRALREVAVIQGVLEVRDAKFWTLVDGHLVATIKLRLSEQATQGSVLQDVRNVMSALVGSLTVEFEDASTQLNAALAVTGFDDYNMTKGSNGGHHDSHGHSHQCHGHSHNHGHSHGGSSSLQHAEPTAPVVQETSYFPPAPESTGSVATVSHQSNEFGSALPPPPGFSTSQNYHADRERRSGSASSHSLPPPPMSAATHSNSISPPQRSSSTASLTSTPAPAASVAARSDPFSGGAAGLGGMPPPPLPPPPSSSRR